MKKSVLIIFSIIITSLCFLYVSNKFISTPFSDTNHENQQIVKETFISPNGQNKIVIYNYNNLTGYTSLNVSVITKQSSCPQFGNILMADAIKSVKWLDNNTVNIESVQGYNFKELSDIKVKIVDYEYDKLDTETIKNLYTK